MSSKIYERKTPRIPCELPARLEGARGPIRGRFLDLTPTGTFFAGAFPGIGQRIELGADLPGLGEFRAVGEVRHVTTRGSRPGVGIRFTRLSQEHLARLSAFVGARAPPAGDDC